jgi:hypothetical protein
MPAFKIGGRLRFRASEVLAWLEQHRQGSLTVPPDDASVLGVKST